MEALFFWSGRQERNLNIVLILRRAQRGCSFLAPSQGLVGYPHPPRERGQTVVNIYVGIISVQD